MVQKYRHKIAVKELCIWIMLSRSNFYYKPSGEKRGLKPSSETIKSDGEIVSNVEVVERIKTILSGEFVCDGYQKIAIQLKQEEYIINHKKVYRLMDQNNLLLGKVIRTKGRRQWVKHRRINAEKPMEYLCLDIKYLWVHGEKRYCKINPAILTSKSLFPVLKTPACNFCTFTCPTSRFLPSFLKQKMLIEKRFN